MLRGQGTKPERHTQLQATRELGQQPPRGFVIEEMAPWREDGETLHVLRAKFPAAIASHCPEQDFYFGPDLLLRRHDYQVDIAGSFPTAQYVYDVAELHGFRFPTRRRAHPRGGDGRPNRDWTYIWIDLSDFALS